MARRFPKDPFSVVAKHARGVFLGYEIWVEVAPGVSRPFLECVSTQPRLLRHSAYAITRLLNRQQPARKWAQKFGDPYE